MPLETVILGWTALVLFLVISPGPDTFLVASHAAKGGVRAGLAVIAGTTTGALWYMLLCGFGFLSVLSASPILFNIVKIAGMAYLAWIGFGMLKGAMRPKDISADKSVSLAAPYRQGLLSNLVNPKIAVFYLAALPQFTGNGPDAPLIGALLVAIHYVLGAICLCGLAFAVGRTRQFVGRSAVVARVTRWLEAALGVTFIGLAGRLALVRSS